MDKARRQEAAILPIRGNVIIRSAKYVEWVLHRYVRRPLAADLAAGHAGGVTHAKSYNRLARDSGTHAGKAQTALPRELSASKYSIRCNAHHELRVCNTPGHRLLATQASIRTSNKDKLNQSMIASAKQSMLSPGRQAPQK